LCRKQLTRPSQEKQAKEAAAAAAAGTKGPRQSPGELRVAKGAPAGRWARHRQALPALAPSGAPRLADACWRADISELNLGKTTSIFFPEGKEKLLAFEVTIKPDEGYYKCGPPAHRRIARA